jgi:hypothetical protein
MGDETATVPPTVGACSIIIGGYLRESRLLMSSVLGGPGYNKVGFCVCDGMSLSTNEGLASPCDVPWFSWGSNGSERSSAVIPVGLCGELGLGRS